MQLAANLGFQFPTKENSQEAYCNDQPSLQKMQVFVLNTRRFLLKYVKKYYDGNFRLTLITFRRNVAFCTVESAFGSVYLKTTRNQARF